MIMTREFKNLSENGRVHGFQIKVRIPYYRGVCLSLVDTIQLVVDGEEFPLEKMTFTVGGRTFTFAEMERATDVRWFFGEPATLTVSKPAGLKPGLHTVQLGIFIRTSYIPRFDRENLYDFVPGVQGLDRATGWGTPPARLPLTTKRMTLVQ
jgi:hypothetical protein